MNERIAAFAEMCKEAGFSESEIAEFVEVANQASQELANQELGQDELDHQEYLRQVREGLQPQTTQAELGDQSHQPEAIQSQHAELQHAEVPPEYDDTQSNPEKAPLCNHLFAASPTVPAHLCGSPALRGEPFCYFHHPTRKPVRNPHERRARRVARQSFNFRLPTTRSELQFSLDAVASRIANNQIDVRRASQLLYALQMAERNM